MRANPPARAAAASRRTYGATTLKLDAGAVAALTGLGVAPAPIAPAYALPSGELAFPITNAPFWALLSGTIKHSGGISLTAGATTVKLENFWIDPLRRQLTALGRRRARADPRPRLRQDADRPRRRVAERRPGRRLADRRSPRARSTARSAFRPGPSRPA